MTVSVPVSVNPNFVEGDEAAIKHSPNIEGLIQFSRKVSSKARHSLFFSSSFANAPISYFQLFGSLHL
jgi:hypothetical protein